MPVGLPEKVAEGIYEAVDSGDIQMEALKHPWNGF